MFKNFISALKEISANIYFLSQDIKRIKSFSSSQDYYYIVKIEYEDCDTQSTRFFSLREVNDFINLVGLVRRPSSITIFKDFDDGR